MKRRRCRKIVMAAEEMVVMVRVVEVKERFCLGIGGGIGDIS